jgi:hypothetical protein
VRGRFAKFEIQDFTETYFFKVPVGLDHNTQFCHSIRVSSNERDCQHGRQYNFGHFHRWFNNAYKRSSSNTCLSIDVGKYLGYFEK